MVNRIRKKGWKFFMRLGTNALIIRSWLKKQEQEVFLPTALKCKRIGEDTDKARI